MATDASQDQETGKLMQKDEKEDLMNENANENNFDDDNAYDLKLCIFI